ncbi:MAG TPA: sugar ABC transporter permease [Actinoplanes sp.]|nr:sugar ABC transporter permease [Actinoplanes sp.]
MYRGWRRRWLGLLYLSPALLFVLAFTVYPLTQMAWMSLHNWSLISPPTWVGLSNYTRAFNDHQFWVSFGFTLKYTLIITPILIIGGYLLALLASGNTPLLRVTRTVLFTPVVIGLGVSSLLWYWLFSTDFGLINATLQDLGVISEPVVWLGVDADRSNYAIIVSVVWKVIGFGMVLFIGAIQAIPTEVTEASVVDGAGFWQRVTRIVLPLTLRTVLLVTLLSVVGSLLAFDQFYIMTAGQPQNQTSTSVFFVYLNSFPYLRLGYGAALSMVLALTILAFTVVQLLLTRRSHA